MSNRKYALSMKLTLAGLAVTVSLTALAGCAAQAGAQSSAPDPSAVVAELAGKGSAGSQSAEKKLTQRSSGGSVTIDVTWENPKDTAGPRFAIVMDTHSVELDGYDLGKLSVLRNDQGVEVKPQQWDSAPGGHHRTGTLMFPSADASGKTVVGAGVKRLELVIRDVSGVKERILKWEVGQ
jgi:hypothetical protein